MGRERRERVEGWGRKVREKERELNWPNDSNTEHLSPITCLKLLRLLQLLLFGRSTIEWNWTRGSWACQQQEGNDLYCCKEDADFKSLNLQRGEMEMCWTWVWLAAFLICRSQGNKHWEMAEMKINAFSSTVPHPPLSFRPHSAHDKGVKARK